MLRSHAGVGRPLLEIGVRREVGGIDEKLKGIPKGKKKKKTLRGIYMNIFILVEDL